MLQGLFASPINIREDSLGLAWESLGDYANLLFMNEAPAHSPARKKQERFLTECHSRDACGGSAKEELPFCAAQLYFPSSAGIWQIGQNCTSYRGSLGALGSALDVLTHVADLKRGVALMEAIGQPLGINPWTSNNPWTSKPKLKLLEQWDLYFSAAVACCRNETQPQSADWPGEAGFATRGSSFTLLHQRHRHLQRACQGLCKR